jgi:hypothetical protein
MITFKPIINEIRNSDRKKVFTENLPLRDSREYDYHELLRSMPDKVETI